MNVAAYLRVSSRAQDAASQRSAIERYAAARGDVITAWYSEKRSGKTIDRAELQRLRADVRSGAVYRVYTFRLDRLARSGIRDMFEIIEEMRAHNCEIASVADGFSLDGPAAEVVLAVISWAAKMERLAINERIAAARDRLSAEGRGWGRPSRFSNSDVQRAIEMRNQGRTVRDIAVALKVPRSTVGRMLSQKVDRKSAQKNDDGAGAKQVDA